MANDTTNSYIEGFEERAQKLKENLHLGWLTVWRMGNDKTNSHIERLKEKSILQQAKRLARKFSGTGALWQLPYSAARPHAAAEAASVWFAAYPPSIITLKDQSVLQTLGDDALWQSLEEIGIEAIHTGPVKLAGGVLGDQFTPTVDGNFDRIGVSIAPQLGTTEDYVHLCEAAARHDAIVIDDIIPGHTGKGPDFRLAEYGVDDYPGIYHMVQIAPEDWSLLPPVPEGQDAVNLTPGTVDILRNKGYIVGRLSRVIFYEPGVKETNWSATAEVRGVDGLVRRWVYLHYFKAGQPSLNWLDPSFAAPRLVVGDVIHSMAELGAKMLRLDANGFLGIEPRAGGSAWSEGHPLSITANQLIAGMVRKLGGFTFQELNLSVDDIATMMSRGAADLSYDFVTRPAYHHALVTRNTEFLRLMLRTAHEYGVDPASLIHALQNHDELTLELVHFWTSHKDENYNWGGRTVTGSELREQIRDTMYAHLTGEGAPYNMCFATNGVASTTASVIAAALGYTTLDDLSTDQIALIRRVHLLLCMYNAFQPGIFALSGWDLVGALPLSEGLVANLMTDGDTRWINRGAYDLMDVVPDGQRSACDLPRAHALYGSLPTQLADPDSFASQLQKLLAVRKRLCIYAAQQTGIPDVTHPALLVMTHLLPDGDTIQITALNFGPERLEEAVRVAGAQGRQAIDVLGEVEPDPVCLDEAVLLTLGGYEGRAFVLKSLPPMQ